MLDTGFVKGERSKESPILKVSSPFHFSLAPYQLASFTKVT